MKSRLFIFLAFVLALAVAVPASAQVQAGIVGGTVKDEQGGVLPGAAVSLVGSDRTLSFTTGTDGKFRFLNLPPGSYKVSASLAGFKTFVWENVVVTVGREADLPVVLAVAAVTESVTVVGESPIIDTKALGTATNFTQDELAKIPNSRDPWALLRTVPGVIMDRVNIAGNETGQQSGFYSKGTRPADSVWTMDGIVITDMAAVGASPTYFDYDAFDEIQISTAGNDIRQPTGGVGLNFVVKRGGNAFGGTARAYYTDEGLEASNVHPELAARGVTEATADHNVQIADYGGDIGGPIFKDKAWFWVSWTKQDIRVFRNATNALDQTILKTTNAKGNWQITNNDMFSVLWFNGSKQKYGRQPGRAGVEPRSATYNQDNFYPDNIAPPGLLKLENNHIFSPNLFVDVKYAYYATGFTLESIGPLTDQAGVSSRLGQTFGSTDSQYFLRPQTTIAADSNYFKEAWGGNNEIKFGGGYRRAEGSSRALWPGNMVVALDNSLTNQRARVYREGAGGNLAKYFNLYVGDTFTRNRLTLNVGVRYDRQWGEAYASSTLANAGFPSLVPGISFGGYETPFTWNNLSPRVGITYALDSTQKTLLRGSYTRYAGQLSTGIVGYLNPTSAAGWVEYPWVDANADHFAQSSEVNTSVAPLAFGNGFNPSAPTAVTSPNRFDPDLKAPITTGVVIGLDRELRPDLAIAVAYTYNQVSNFTATPWVGLTAADYAAGTPVIGTLPEGGTYNVPTYIPSATQIAANANARILTNYDGFKTAFNGFEMSVNKRMSNRWMARLGFSYNDVVEYYDMNPAVTDFGNPTQTDLYPLQSGAPSFVRTAGSGAGDVFLNGMWQLNASGAYQLPYDIEIAGNLFGRQGNLFPFYANAALGLDGTNRILVSPSIDSTRFDSIWNFDLRFAKNIKVNRTNLQFVADLFNVLNSNVELNRERNRLSPNFQRLNSTLSPRILRFGVRFGF